MPVFEQSYPSWTPTRAVRLRWWPIVRRELQVLTAQKGFKLLLIVAALPTLIHLLQIYSVNKLAAEPHGELARMFRHVELTIDAGFFFGFLQVQMYFVFVLLLYASSGSVCDDIRLNLAEVYFSKPVTARDYITGKVVTVLGLGLVYTAVPALFLFGAQALMQHDGAFLRAHAWLPLACVAYSAVVVIPTGLATLACSAATRSRRYAAAAIIALLVANTFVATLLADVLSLREANIVSIPAAMVRVGDSLFDVRPDIPLAWGWALTVVAAVAALGLAVLTRRIRRAEVGA